MGALSAVKAAVKATKFNKLNAITRLEAKESAEAFITSLQNKSKKFKAQADDYIEQTTQGFIVRPEGLDRDSIFDLSDIEDVEKGFEDLFALGVSRRREVPPTFPSLEEGRLFNNNLIVKKDIKEDLVNNMQRESWIRRGEVGPAESAAAIHKFTSGPQKDLTEYFNRLATGADLSDIPELRQEVLLGWDRALLKTAKPLEDHTLLYRGIALDEDKDVLIQSIGGGPSTLKEGSEFVFISHSSFSFNEVNAKEFMSSADARMLFIIENPKNIKGIDVTKTTEEFLGKENSLTRGKQGLNKKESDVINELNEFTGEAEFILMRQQPLVVKRIVSEGSSPVIIYLEPLENVEEAFIFAQSRLSGLGGSGEAEQMFVVQMPQKNNRKGRFNLPASSEEDVKNILLQMIKDDNPVLTDLGFDIPALKTMLDNFKKD